MMIEPCGILLLLEELSMMSPKLPFSMILKQPLLAICWEAGRECLVCKLYCLPRTDATSPNFQDWLLAMCTTAEAHPVGVEAGANYNLVSHVQLKAAGQNTAVPQYHNATMHAMAS
jgi:hypothetical protein